MMRSALSDPGPKSAGKRLLRRGMELPTINVVILPASVTLSQSFLREFSITLFSDTKRHLMKVHFAREASNLVIPFN